MQVFPFIPNVLDSANRRLREIPGAQKHCRMNQHCSSALLQQGGVAQLYSLAKYGAPGGGQGFAPLTPANTPARNQHNLPPNSLAQVAPHKRQNRNFLSLGLPLLFCQGCPWPAPAIVRSWEDLTARIQQEQPANPSAGLWVVTGVLERKIHLLSSARACPGHGG